MTPTNEIPTRAVTAPPANESRAILPMERPSSSLAMLSATASIDTMKAMQLIREFVKGELKEDLDFGVIPGTKKPTLLLPGAQKIAMLFNTRPQYDVRAVDLGNGHIEYMVTAHLISRATLEAVGAGVGSCSTMEKKYRWRNAERKCPDCDSESIIKGKAEWGGGWICWAKKDGCGAKFLDEDPRITDQQGGRVENEDIADVRNTVLKMAKKRAVVDAAMGLGCVAEMFTQDMEDAAHDHEPERPVRSAPAPRQAEPPRQQPQQQPATQPAQQAPTNGTPAEPLAVKIAQLESRLVERGLCKAGELVQHLLTIGAKTGQPADDLAKWPDKARAPAMDLAKQFLSSRRLEYLGPAMQRAQMTLDQTIDYLKLPRDTPVYKWTWPEWDSAVETLKEEEGMVALRAAAKAG